MSYLFVFRSYPDVDHMVPLVWKLLEEGEEVHAVVSPDYDPHGDHHLRFVSRYPGFHLHEVWPEGGSRLRGTLRSTLFHALGTIVRHRVRVVAVEWGYGLNEGYERLLSLAGLRDVARSVVRSLRLAPRRDRFQTRTNYIVAARLLRRATVSLPHGLSVKLTAASNDEAVERMANGGIDWRDRSRLSAYVFNSEHHRRINVEHFNINPEVAQTWGSLRWAPDWFEVNRSIAPQYAWPAEGADKLKVVLMAPKWQNRVHKDAVLDLVKRLQALPGVSLAIKGHPRKAASDPLREDPQIAWDHIHDVSSVDSVPLIRACDVVLDVGSSIGLEVVMQGKLLVNPTYIHELTTLFDEIPGSCVVAHDADDVVRALDDAAASNGGRKLTSEAEQELMRRAVYGEREPFDVLQLHYDRFRELAGAPAPRR